MTPFETWSVTFPHNVNNKGIKFDADAAVEIEFKTNVIAKTPPNMNPALAMRYNSRREAFKKIIEKRERETL